MQGWMNHELGYSGPFAKPIEPQPKLTKGFSFLFQNFEWESTNFGCQIILA
jgi:hypothetical protein